MQGGLQVDRRERLKRWFSKSHRCSAACCAGLPSCMSTSSMRMLRSIRGCELLLSMRLLLLIVVSLFLRSNPPVTVSFGAVLILGESSLR